MTDEELWSMAAEVASELQSATGALPEPLRERFIQVRTALFQRGIFDPVLVRFDTASAPKASAKEIGEQLAAVVDSI
jgi:hypothetical protein